MTVKRIVLGVSGASGMPYALRLAEVLNHTAGVEPHLIPTASAATVLKAEADLPLEALTRHAAGVHDNDDLAAPPASGSWRCHAMVVCPCSMNTLAGIAHGHASNLLLRAADVTLKERRRLVLVPREAPLGLLHLRNLQTAAELGATILPPVLTFYGRPRSVEELITPVIGRIIDAFGLDLPGFSRWEPDRS